MGKTIALQGMGHVGYHLAQYLVEAGARVLGSDINTINLRRAERDLGVVAVAADDILYQTCDVLAPCAMGAILNEASIPRLKARVIAGNHEVGNELLQSVQPILFETTPDEVRENVLDMKQRIEEKLQREGGQWGQVKACLLYTSPSPRDVEESRMPSSA